MRARGLSPHTHLSGECVGVVWSERSRVTQVNSAAGTRPRWREAERTQQTFFKRCCPAALRAHTRRSFYKQKSFFFFFLLKMFLVPQTRNICLGWTRHVVQPACERAKRSSVGDYFASSCGLGATERAACCVCCAEIRWPPGRTGHHAPAVGCSLDRSCAPVRGGGTILQRPV